MRAKGVRSPFTLMDEILPDLIIKELLSSSLGDICATVELNKRLTSAAQACKSLKTRGIHVERLDVSGVELLPLERKKER